MNSLAGPVAKLRRRGFSSSKSCDWRWLLFFEDMSTCLVAKVCLWKVLLLVDELIEFGVAGCCGTQLRVVWRILNQIGVGKDYIERGGKCCEGT
jgi:hypothetical protein